MMRVQRIGASWTVAAVALGAASGAVLPLVPIAGEFVLGVVAAVLVGFALPPTMLLYAFVFLSLSGVRPLPPIFGYDVQAQYILLPAICARFFLFTRAQGPARQRQTRPLIWSVVLLLAASVVALAQDVVILTPDLSTVVGDYIKW